MGARVSRGDRQVCECTNKLTTTEGKIQDKHQSIMYVFTLVYRRKLIKSELYIRLQILKVDKFLVGNW